jgi:heat shock protein HslJ
MILAIAGSVLGQSSIAGHDWSAIYLKGVNIGKIEAFIKIDTDGKRFTGNTGCNIMNGSVNIDRERIKFSAVITTKRACTRKTAPIERAMLTALNNATSFKLSHSRLRLFSGKSLLGEFGPRPANIDKDGPLTGTDKLKLEDRKWVLESISRSVVPNVEQKAFLVFDPVKKSAGGDTSCNAFGGEYKTNADKIAITEIISTMRACIEDERMNIEREFLDGLRTADSYKIEGDKLMLYRRGKLLLTFLGDKK